MDKKILICDDDEKTRASLKLILSNHYEILIVDSGAQALHVLNNTPDIAIALFDMLMTEIKETELLINIKEKYPGLKIILITGYNFTEIKDKTTHFGIKDFIVKPFNPEEILNIVKQL